MKYAQQGKVSGLFLVLITVAMCVFIGFMWEIYRDKAQTHAIVMAEQQQVQGKNTPKVAVVSRAETSTKPEARTTYQTLISSITARDNSSTQQAINQLVELQGLQERSAKALQSAIAAENDYAFEMLLNAGADCKTSAAKLARPAVHANSDRFLTLLLAADCGLQENPTKSLVISHIMVSKQIERIFLYPQDEEIISLYPKLLEKSIASNRPTLAMELLDKGVDPNTLNRDGSLTVLELSVERGQPDIALKLIALGADTFIVMDQQVPRYLLSRAVKRNQFAVAQEILKRNPDQIKKGSLSNILFQHILRDDNLFNTKWIALIVNNGGDLHFAPQSDLNILSKAIAQKDLQLTEYLLSQGADPNALILSSTLLGRARRLEGEEGKKIVAVLEKYGALDDVLSQARLARGIDNNAVCNLGKKIVIPKLNHFSNELITQARSAKTIPDQVQLCEQGIAYCMQQGGGADDCVYSLPSCNASQATEIDLCCPTQTKDRYFAGRCAGLTVQETAYWQSSLEQSR